MTPAMPPIAVRAASPATTTRARQSPRWDRLWACFLGFRIAARFTRNWHYGAEMCAAACTSVQVVWCPTAALYMAFCWQVPKRGHFAAADDSERRAQAAMAVPFRGRDADTTTSSRNM